MKQKIKKAAVLGAGMMGSAIAAHLANVGIPSFLLDIVPPEMTEAEKKKGLTFESPAVRNRFAISGKNRIQETKPASLYLKEDAELMTIGDFEERFLGTHFFNPPRYMKLLEIIPTPSTSRSVVERMAEVGEKILGKGVVYAKDTPNFIGNRIGAFATAITMRTAIEDGYRIEEGDPITV